MDPSLESDDDWLDDSVEEIKCFVSELTFSSVQVSNSTTFPTQTFSAAFCVSLLALVACARRTVLLGG